MISSRFDPAENERKWQELNEKADQKLAELDEQIAQENTLCEKIKSRLRSISRWSKIYGIICALCFFAGGMTAWFFHTKNEGVALATAVVNSCFLAIMWGFLAFILDDLFFQKKNKQTLERQLEDCLRRIVGLMRQKKEILEQYNDMMRARLKCIDFDIALVYAMDYEMSRVGGIFDC